MPNPAPDNSKRATFLRRSASTLGLWAVVGIGLYSRQAWAYLGIIGILTLISAREYFQMLKAGGVKCFPRYGMLLTVAYTGFLYWLMLRHGNPTGSGVPEWFDGVAIFAAIAGAFTLQLRYPIRGVEALQAVAVNLLGFVYVPFLFSFAARIVFEVPGPGQVPGAMLLLWLIAVTKFTDMGAYLVGSMIGKHKMIPHVSPGKTWQGFGGAIFFSLLAGCGLYAGFQNDMPNFAAGLHLLGGWGNVVGVSIVLCLLAVVGDLAESVLKRSLGVKDSGNMLPGIGGGLDLIDSLCFTAPALYFYLKWMSH